MVEVSPIQSVVDTGFHKVGPTEPTPAADPTLGATPEPTSDQVQAQMAQMAEAIAAIAQSQQQLNQTAQELMRNSQPQQQYLNSLEQGQVPSQQPLTDWDQMTQAQMAEAIFQQMGEAMNRASSQYGQMLKTILPEHEVWKPEIRDKVGQLMQRGVPFEEAYKVVKAESQTQQQTTTQPDGKDNGSQGIEAEINKRVQAELTKRRANIASAAGRPGMTAAEAVKLPPQEQFHQDWQKHVVEGQALPADTTRGL